MSSPAAWGRRFDPDRLASLEVRMWKAYYRRQPVRLAALLVREPGLRRSPIAAHEVAGHGEFVSAIGDLRTLPCHLPDPDPAMAGLDGFYAARLERP